MFAIGPALNILNSQVAMLNGSKIFAGVIMITLNVCSRFINFNLGKTSEAIIKSNFPKQLLVFSISWMGTRDIYTALILTAVFTILFDILFNEDSYGCVIPQKYRILTQALDTNKDGVVSEEEIKSAMAVLDKANKDKTKQQQRTSLAMFHSYSGANVFAN